MDLDRTIKRLEALCEHAHDKIDYPFSIEWRGSRWIGATEGHVMVLIRSDVKLSAPIIPIGRSLELYRPGPAVSFSGLKEFAGPFEGVTKQCSRCDGQGSCPRCETECFHCDGDGWVFPDARPGSIGDASLDLNLLSTALEIVTPTETVEVTVIDDVSPVYFKTDDWLIVVMAYKVDSSEGLSRFDLRETVAVSEI